jgi:hypothetical protein
MRKRTTPSRSRDDYFFKVNTYKDTDKIIMQGQLAYQRVARSIMNPHKVNYKFGIPDDDFALGLITLRIRITHI